MRRVLDVTRVLTVSWFWTLAFPVVLIVAVLLLNLALFAVVGTGDEGTSIGAAMALYIALGITHLQTMTQSFPFALGMSVTRRTFYAAVALLVTAQSVGYGLLLMLLARLEVATGGWGIDLAVFALPFLPQDDPLVLWLAFAVPLLATCALAVFLGGVFVRWGPPGVWAVLLGGAVVLVGVAALIGWLDAWAAVGTFLASRSPVTLAAGYPLVLALLLGGAGWLVLRRATP